MIDITIFLDYYFFNWLFGASAIMGVMLLIKKIILRR